LPLDGVVPELAGFLADARNGRRLVQGQTTLNRSGRERIFNVRVTTEPGTAGTQRGFVVTLDDITDLIAAQRSSAWADVARRIAHEIKNPLTPIQLSAERLRRKYRKDIAPHELETFDRCTDTIVRQVGDIGRMVDEFSAFARLPAPRVTEQDAAELLRAALFAQRVASPDIDVELVEPTPDIRLVADGGMLGQALTNVLKNAAVAVAARPAPTLRGQVRARLVSNETGVAFEVEDNGIGLPAKDRDRLTEPYVTTREKGTGLGLAIVKRILEDHGGELVLTDAREGSGALAILRLPPSARARSAPVSRAVTA
ncbi:ATP-binding protein, partial [Phenylobacterium sp.]|uniref:sensor histidine kinase n=1 Tax=Phenylobacterium sp. TaxID=1871053 RepID=UPI00286CF558